MDIKPHILRTIAHAELEQILPAQAAEVHEALVTSIVRQWITYDGKAGILTPEIHHWLMVGQKETRIDVGRGVAPESLWPALAQWNVAEEELPRVLLDLNLSQCVTVVSNDGRTVQIRMDPRERLFEFAEVIDTDPEIETHD